MHVARPYACNHGSMSTLTADPVCDGLMVASRIFLGGSMRNRIWSGTLAAIVGIATVGLVAQTTTPQTTTTTTSSSDKKITVTGCLQAAPPSAAASATGQVGTSATPG